MRQPRAYVYVDAWNLFYGALSKTPFKAQVRNTR